MNPEYPYTKNGYWLPTVIFDKSLKFNRNAFFGFMKSNNIDSRPFFYPLSALPMFEKKKENTISYDIYERGINLPSYHDMTKENVQKVSKVIFEYLKKNNR